MIPFLQENPIKFLFLFFLCEEPLMYCGNTIGDMFPHRNMRRQFWFLRWGQTSVKRFRCNFSSCSPSMGAEKTYGNIFPKWSPKISGKFSPTCFPKEGAKKYGKMFPKEGAKNTGKRFSHRYFKRNFCRVSQDPLRAGSSVSVFFLNSNQE